MTALVSAELLRLRTVRGPARVGLGGLALIVLVAAANLNAVGAQPPADAAESIRMLALLGVLLPAVAVAATVGSEFHRGAAAMTYLSHPDRPRVTAARMVVHAGLGLVFAATAAGAVIAIGSAVAGDTGLSAADQVQLVAGAAAGGAIMCSAGVLVGTVTASPAIAGVAIFGLQVVESVNGSAGAGAYLPFALVGSLIGNGGDVPPLAALALLIAYVSAFALAVRAWSLPRDLA